MTNNRVVQYEDEPERSSSLFEVFETFSATILQGLFDLRHRFSEDDLAVQEMKLEATASTLPSAAPSIMLPQVDQLIENFHKLRAGEFIFEEEEDADAVESLMISRSLYSLEVVDEEVLLIDPAVDTLDEEDESEIEFAGHEQHHPPDVYTAEAASTFLVKESIQTAAKQTGELKTGRKYEWDFKF